MTQVIWVDSRMRVSGTDSDFEVAERPVCGRQGSTGISGQGSGGFSRPPASAPRGDSRQPANVSPFSRPGQAATATGRRPMADAGPDKPFQMEEDDTLPF